MATQNKREHIQFKGLAAEGQTVRGRREGGMSRDTCRDGKHLKIVLDKDWNQLGPCSCSINSTQLRSSVSRRERHGPRDTPCKSCWIGTQMRSSLPQSQISSSQLISFVSGSGVPLLTGRAGALSGDVWILSWGGGVRRICRGANVRGQLSANRPNYNNWSQHPVRSILPAWFSLLRLCQLIPKCSVSSAGLETREQTGDVVSAVATCSSAVLSRSLKQRRRNRPLSYQLQNHPPLTTLRFILVESTQSKWLCSGMERWHAWL